MTQKGRSSCRCNKKSLKTEGGFIKYYLIDAPLVLMAQTNPFFGVQILENAMKKKEDNYRRKSMSDGTNREKVHRETKNMEDLVKRKEISDKSNTIALD